MGSTRVEPHRTSGVIGSAATILFEKITDRLCEVGGSVTTKIVRQQISRGCGAKFETLRLSPAGDLSIQPHRPLFAVGTELAVSA
jgi:hypothetical protein